MREIKFRGKRVDNGEWVRGKYLQATDHWSNSRGKHKDWIVTGMIQNGGWVALLGRYAVIHETVGQYTGLKDKNGVEIYEGDLLKPEDYPPQEVFWDEGGFSMDDYWLVDWYDDTVIIGNIHDNPELMEVEQ